MINVENIDVWGFKHAIRGMRNPMNSWDKSDSGYEPANFCDHSFVVGDNDLDLMKRLFKAGTEHRKYIRHIFVSMDITAPLYWWKEFDTYKFTDPDLPHIDTNSCSTMHKIAAKEFELDDFSCEHLKDCESVALTEFYDFPCGRRYTPMDSLNDTIKILNFWRSRYLETKNKSDWWQLIQLLPSSYNQRRTIVFSYETVVSIIKQRSGHKLDEWRDFVEILRELPYVIDIVG